MTSYSEAEQTQADHDASPLLTIEEAARYLRIGRSLAYELASVYLATGGTDGLPVIRCGTLLRVPRWALVELATTGNVVRLGPGPSARITTPAR